MNRKKNIVIVSDIFGQTPALVELATRISGKHQIVILDPYAGKQMMFDNESTAYQAFTTEVGIERYYQLVEHRLAQLPSIDFIIGFSVGATVIWKLAANNPQLLSSSSSVCFYGGQIRYWLSLTPQYPLTMIFPRHEAHFNLDEMLDKLAQFKQLTVIKTPYLHGFMNELSSNFDGEGFQQYCDYCQRLIENSPS